MLALILAATLDPLVAAHLGAAMAGHPEFGPQLEAIGRRESCLRLVGIHPGDAGRSRAVWTDAVRAGLVDPQCQPYRAGAWSTRGSFGTMAALTVVHIGVPCMPYWSIDIPIVAAFAATRRAHARRCSQVLGCRQWRDGKPKPDAPGNQQGETYLIRHGADHRLDAVGS